jgi:uroporphyrinogen decarboxylase
MITHRERLQACLNGEAADRPPVALWRHFPVDDQQPGSLAASTLQFQQAYDFDLIKVTPASSFCLKDWGVLDEWRGNPEGTRQYTKRVIVTPGDWERLPLLAPGAAHLAAQLECLQEVRQAAGSGTPVLQTIFSPLAQARNLAGAEQLLAHLRLYPEAVLKGLATIAETTRRFVEASMGTGIDGVFYAVQHAQAQLLSLHEYKIFGLPFDQLVLQPARQAWCNMLHLHGQNIHFELASLLPVQVVNWHDRDTAPSLSGGLASFAGAVCGGLGQETLVFDTSNAVEHEAADAIRQTGGQRFILSTGCVVPVIAPHGNIRAARRAVETPISHANGMEPLI